MAPMSELLTSDQPHAASHCQVHAWFPQGGTRWQVLQKLQMALLSPPDLRLRLLLTHLPAAGRVRPTPGARLCQAGLALCGWFCHDVLGGDGAWTVTVVACGLCLLQNPCHFGQSLPPQYKKLVF